MNVCSHFHDFMLLSWNPLVKDIWRPPTKRHGGRDEVRLRHWFSAKRRIACHAPAVQPDAIEQKCQELNDSSQSRCGPAKQSSRAHGQALTNLASCGGKSSSIRT